jgi:hypothetical protein
MGVPLLIAPAASKADPSLLVSLLAHHRVTRLILVPSLLRVFLALAAEMPEVLTPIAESKVQPGESGMERGGHRGLLGTLLPDLKYWTTSGEALTYDLMAQFFASAPLAVRSLFILFNYFPMKIDEIFLLSIRPIFSSFLLCDVTSQLSLSNLEYRQKGTAQLIREYRVRGGHHLG